MVATTPAYPGIPWGWWGRSPVKHLYPVFIFIFFTPFTFIPSSMYHIISYLLDLNNYNYYIAAYISAIYLLLFIKFKDTFDYYINYFDDININIIIYVITYSMYFYIIGIKFNKEFYISMAISSIIIDLLLFIYLYINYIYALYILKTYKISMLIKNVYIYKSLLRSKNIEAKYYEEKDIVCCSHNITNSYIIRYNYDGKENPLIGLFSNKNLKEITTNNDFANIIINTTIDSISLSILEFIIGNKEKISIIGIIVGIIKLLFI